MITELTKEQEQQIPVYLKKWLDVGHKTDRIDDKKAKEAIDFLYADILKKGKPKIYLKFSSPLVCQLAINALNMSEGAQPSSQLYSQLSAQLRSQLGSQLHSQLRSQLHSQLGSRLSSQLGSQLESQAFEYFCPTTSNWYFCYYWFWTYDYVLNELLPEKKKKFQKFNDFMSHVENIHQVYMFDEIVFYSDYPVAIQKNENGLHCETGLALEYSDSAGIYSLNGIRCPEYVVTTPKDNFTKEMILEEENADVRREILRKLGPEKMIDILNPEVVDSKYGYDLYGIELNDNRIRPFLKMVNPSIGTVHVEGVQPDCKTVEDAVTYRNGLDQFDNPILLDGVDMGGFAYYQTGDVLYFPIPELTSNKKKDGNIVHSGQDHTHRIRGDFQLYDNSEIECKSDCTLFHAEHADTELPKGLYETKIVLEYDHWLEESREVID